VLEDANYNLLFLCVDRLNSGIKALDKNLPHFQLQLCRLNFEAAKKAVDLAAFEHALAYCQNGLALLQEEEDNCWEKHYDLSLGRNTLHACMCLPTGQDMALRASVQLVVQHAKTIEDSTESR
jgi:predicted ATPase